MIPLLTNWKKIRKNLEKNENNLFSSIDTKYLGGITMRKFNEIRKIFFHYNCYAFKVKNSDYATMLQSGEGFSEQHLQFCKKYINIVDEAISKLDKYEQQLVDHVYIKGLPRTDLPYSVATYYNKRNKALEKLSSLLITTNINEIIN